MKNFRIGWLAVVIAGAALLVGSVAAQGNGPQVSLGTAFTYQGQLKRNGTPVNNTCDMQFGLYAAVSGGTALGTQSRSGVSVTNGLFTIPDLDFGASAFTGEARWLDIAVKCTGDASFVTLSPRPALTGVPYAHSLRPGATVNGLNDAGSLSFGSVTRQMINLWDTRYAIGVQNATFYERVDLGAGYAWYQGGTHSNVPNDPGAGGKTLMSLDGSGVLTVRNRIQTSISDPSLAAVTGRNSGEGKGIAGYANGCSVSEFCDDVGVYGENTGYGPGVRGRSSTGIGVEGGGTSAGVSGYSSPGDGVQGRSDSRNGVQGQSSSSTASGVYGENLAGGYGVAGRANGTGLAVYGDNIGPGGWAGYFHGSVFVDGSLGFTGALVGGNKSGYVSDFALNDGHEALSAGDVVVVVGYAPPLVGTIPVARVVKASTAYQTGVIGVMDQHVIRGDTPRFVDEPAAPGEYVNVVTLGMFRAVKVDASLGAIHAGDLLVASPHAGYAMKAADRSQAIGAIIGKALGDLASGAGSVPVIVTLQ